MSTAVEDWSERLRCLKNTLWQKRREIRDLENEIDEVKQRVQSQCDHEWVFDDSARGGRSYHMCKHCDAYR